MSTWIRFPSGYINIDQIAKFNLNGDSGEALLSTGLKVIFKGSELAAIVAALEQQLQLSSTEQAGPSKPIADEAVARQR